MTEYIDQPLIGRGDHFAKLRDAVERYGLRNLVESGTGPHSSGLEAASRLGLQGYSCDVYKPCVERAALVYPDAKLWWASSVDMFKSVLPALEGGTFFWLDGHCPTDQACLPGGIFPVWEEMTLIRNLKAGYARDVIWVDDCSMIAVPDNPSALEWGGVLGSTGEVWHGEKSHTWAEYLAFFADTHEAIVEGSLLRLHPK